MAQLWDVVGGSGKGGIVVRENVETTSKALPNRLASGSIVEGLEISGERLRYKLVSGTGPESGWVSILLKGKALVEKVSAGKRHVSQLVPITDRDLADVPVRWRDAADKGVRALSKELDLTLAETLADDVSMPSRMPKIIQEIFKFLAELTAGRNAKDNAKLGGSLVTSLFTMSCSLTLHEVRAKKASSKEAPCALILGFAGSGIFDIQAQMEFYQKQGFSTIACTPFGAPSALSFRQRERIASELSSALEDGTKLLLHMCSNNGVICGMEILGQWLAGKAPFAKLPALADTLSSVVFDCAPSFPTDPSTGEIIDPASSTDEGSGIKPEDLEAAQNSEIDFYVKVIMGTIGGLTAHWAGKYDRGAKCSLTDMVKASPAVGECVRNAAAGQALGIDEYMDTAFDYDRVKYSIWDFEKWDVTLAAPIPRLFLYAEGDFLVTQDKVEAYARHVASYNPVAKVVKGKIPKSSHCMCWATHASQAESYVKELLSFSNLAATRIAGSSMGA